MWPGAPQPLHAEFIGQPYPSNPSRDRRRSLRNVVCFAANRGWERFRPRSDGPLISVIVPVHNGLPLLPDALRSVHRQTYKRWECIVVDDGSRDDSAAVVARFASRDGRFRLVRLASRQGVSGARNRGIEVARGQYVVFLDADDELFAHALRARLDTLTRADETVAGAFCSIVPAGIRRETSRRCIAPWRPAPGGWIDFISADGECPFPIHAALTRLEVVRAAGGFEVGQHYAEDWHLWARILRAGWRFLSTGTYGALYRRRSHSAVQQEPVELVRQAARLLKWADQPWSGEPTIDGAPYVFAHPLAYYRRTLQLARRAVHAGWEAILIDRPEALSAALEYLPPTDAYWLSWHLDIDTLLEQALRRTPKDLGFTHAHLNRVKGRSREVLLARISNGG